MFKTFVRAPDYQQSTRSIISNAVIGLCLGLILMTPSCNEGPVSVFFAKTVTISVDNVTCTEAWVRITPIGVDRPTVVLQRDAVPIDTVVLCGSDTTIVDSGLLPGRSYAYSAQTIPTFSVLVQPRPVQVRTMDTTSHEFTWEVTTLGDGGSSVLWDVAIINDTLAYAVGEIYLKDSSGQWDPNAYNAAKWDGVRWTLLRIPFIGACSAVDYPAIRAMWAFSRANMLFTNGGSIVRFDGVNAVMDCGMNSLLTGAINKINAESPRDVYAVGNSGSIVHYDGTSWTKISSATTVSLTDVYGSPDGHHVWVCGWQDFQPTLLIRTEGLTASTVFQTSDWTRYYADSISQPIGSVWTSTNQQVYVATSYGVYRCPASTRGDGTRLSLSAGFLPGFPFRMRGLRDNDIFVVGGFHFMAHYNGVTWRHFTQFQGANGNLHSVAVSAHDVIAVGIVLPSLGIAQAVIIHGRR